jgi:hypothetical protein
MHNLQQKISQKLILKLLTIINKFQQYLPPNFLESILMIQ